MYRSCGVDSFQIIVTIARVLVELKMTVGTAIHLQTHSVHLLLCVFDPWRSWNDGTCPHPQRMPGQANIPLDKSRPADRLVCMPIIPKPPRRINPDGPGIR